MELPQKVTLAGEDLSTEQEVVYLGVTINRKGPTTNCVIERIEAGRKILIKMRTITHRWAPGVRTRRSLVKAFVYSITDYALFLQPVNEEVRKKARALDLMCLSFILGVPIKESHAKHARCVSRMLSYRKGEVHDQDIVAFQKIDDRP